ncbi:DJ-1/PfpI family protein [Xylariales sp. PMI_506]|nr:DJ-1/PfpI family protein [Xylariales sp. PMI_506]
MSSNKIFPKSFGLLLYPGFEALDAFGPMEVLNDLSREKEMTLSIIAATRDPVSTLWKGTHTVGQSVLPTHTFADAPDLDVLIIPGGYGGMEPGADLLDYVRSAASKAGHLITVCNGAAVAARAGILDGKRATTNKAFWKTCVSDGPRTHWIAKARWVQDGNTWTSSGVSAGIDVTLAWVASVFGDQLADSIADGMEFIRAPSSSDDPFAQKYGCEDVPAKY